MMIHTTIYRDHELVARRERQGWRVWISGTDRRTAIHPHPFAAFAAARAEVDQFLNRGARQPLWPGLGGGHRGRGILSAWFRGALSGGARRA